MYREQALENFYMVKEALRWNPKTGLFPHPAPNRSDFNNYKDWKDMERERGKSLSAHRYSDRALTGAGIGAIGGLLLGAATVGPAYAGLYAMGPAALGGLAGLGYAKLEEPKG
jgi:hypothetical protein